MLLLAAIGLGAAAPSAGAQTALRAYVDCIAPQTPTPGHFTTYFGYVNANSSAFDLPAAGPNNFLSSGPEAGQSDDPFPERFEPGWHPRAKAIVRPDSSASALRWYLGSNAAAASRPFPQQITGPLYIGVGGGGDTFEANTLPVCGPHFTGAYSATRSYIPPEIVYDGGASWIALRATTGNTPGSGSDWSPFAAAGSGGAAGPRGSAGTAGAAGSAGQPGAAGAEGTSTPEPTGVSTGKPQRFGAKGKVTVRDRTVKRSSTIVLQYADSKLRRLRPTNVTSVRNGRFTVTGSPRARFTYVVHGGG